MYNYPTTLMNFRCPDYLKQDLDQICKYRNMSRTSMLLAHIEKLVEEWKPRVQNATQSPPKPKKTSAWTIASPSIERDDDDFLPMFSTNETDNAW